MPRPKGKSAKGSRSPAAELERRARVPGPKRGPGRPPIHAEEWTKVTVVLFNRQVEFLDRMAASIHVHTGASISRAQLIRALVDAVAEADIDMTSARSEADMKATLLTRLGRYRLGS